MSKDFVAFKKIYFIQLLVQVRSLYVINTVMGSSEWFHIFNLV